jgi:predicted MFS family arabinose efflux permease
VDSPRQLVPVLVAITMVTGVVSSLGAPLIPDIATRLHVPLQSAQWSLTVALLAAAVAAPIMGRLGDGPHRRETILWTLATVIAGSLLAAVAGSLGVLCLGRAMQGIGVGLVPTAMAAAGDHVRPQHVAAVIGMLSVSAAAAVGIAYPLSGLIATAVGLHAAFLVGAAAAAVVMLAAARWVPASTTRERQVLDPIGAATLTVALITLVLALVQGEQWGWSSASTLLLFGAAAALFGLWVPHQLRRPDPLIALHHLAIRPVLTANITAFLLGAALYMFFTLISDFVQVPRTHGFGFGGSALMAGLCLAPFSVTGLLTSRLTASVAGRSAVAALSGGSLLIAGTGLLFAAFHDSIWDALISEALFGVGFGCTMAVMPNMIARAVPSHATGGAMGMWLVTRYVAFSLGSAASATILASDTTSGSGEITAHAYLVGLYVASGLCVAAALVPLLVLRANSETLPARADAPPGEATTETITAGPGKAREA